MRVFYDLNNFVREAVSDDSEIVNSWTGEISQDMEHASLIDEYYLPLYKMSNGVAILITDPADYQVDSRLWALYLKKLNAELAVLISTKTNEELKVIYDASPAYKKIAIGDAINSYWWGKVPQTRINMTYEIIHRLMSELLYIERVEQRTLTEGEQSAVNQLLTMVHEHNAILNLPLAADSWYISYFHAMLEFSDTIRDSHVPQRIAVMGEIDGQLYE